MAGDGIAPRNPGVAALRHMAQDRLQAADSARAADHSQMQADGEHARLAGSFRPEPVERGDHVAGEIVASNESMRLEEIHVVGVERIGQYEPAMAGNVDEERKIVAVSVAVIDEAAMLQEKPSRVDRRRRARMPADRRHARRLADGRHGLGDGAALLSFAHPGMALPPPAMTGHLVSLLDRLARQPWRTVDRAAAGVQRRYGLVLRQRRGDTPPASADPI